MTFPFESLLAEHRQLGLVAGVLIGFAFGFVLERAGFGRAQKLAAQFYFFDMTVFKVMFGAIVTAMLGLVALSGLKLLDLSALSDAASSPTFLWPMVVGGFVLGAGFIISGYCPGTSVVAAASGKLDGAVTVLGVIAGTLVYSELQALIEPFHLSGNYGHLYLYELLHLPLALLAMGVAAMAAAGFLGAELVERKLARKSTAAPPAPAPLRPRRITFATFAALTALCLGTLALPTPTSASPRQELPAISPGELARRLLDEPWRLRVLDLRPRVECAAMRIPGSECVPLDQLEQAGLGEAPTSKDLVLVAGGDAVESPLVIGQSPARVYRLKGGFEGWKRYALDLPAVPGPAASRAELDEHLFRLALNSALTGAAQAPPPPPPTTTAPLKKKKGGGGGCQ